MAVHFINLSICWWTFRLSPCLSGYDQCCSEWTQGADVPWQIDFISLGYVPGNQTTGSNDCSPPLSLSLSSKEEGFVCAQGSTGCSIVGHSLEGMAGTLPRIGKENTRGPTTLLSPFSLFLKSESPAHGLVPPTFGVGLPTLVKHFQEYSLTHSQRRGLAVSLRPGPSCFVFALKKKRHIRLWWPILPLELCFLISRPLSRRCGSCPGRSLLGYLLLFTDSLIEPSILQQLKNNELPSE